MSQPAAVRPPPSALRGRFRRASLRQAYDLALAGALGAIFGLYLYVELVHAEAVWVRDALAGLAIGGTIGYFLNAAGPFRDAAWLKLAHKATCRGGGCLTRHSHYARVRLCGLTIWRLQCTTCRAVFTVLPHCVLR